MNIAAQISAVVIFIAMFGLIISEKVERHIVTLGSGLATLVVVFGICMRSGHAVLETLNLHTFFQSTFWYGASEEASSGINWATIVFIAGMMVMVHGMAYSGFFRWLCMKLAKAVNYEAVPLFLTFMVMSAILAMFIDSITVILFLAAVTVELARMLEFNPVPMILSEIFCANLGGSATMSGDPPNIIIGTALHYTFGDFITNTGLIALIGLVVSIVYFYFAFHKEFRKAPEDKVDTSGFPEPREAIRNRFDFIASTVIFAAAVVMLITHAQTGLTVATIGVFVTVATLLANIKHLRAIFDGFDYKTLLFFVGLFVVVGGLEQTGILDIMADWISRMSQGNTMLMIAIIILGSAIASAFIDNIPFAATMVPVIKELAVMQGVDLQVLAWALSMGTDIGGSATPIGASANVVGTSIAGSNGYPIGWGEYLKKMAPATAIVLFIAMVTIFVRY